jgi:capsular exopolysaccharide synthesis family protein
MFGFGLAIFLALGLVVIAEALDSRVRSTEAISRRLGLRLLARIPDPSPRHFRGDDKLVMLLDPNGPEAEAFRILRTSIELANVEDAAQTIMITSAIEKEGKSTTVANLAVALARAGRHVVLVDLDLRSASLHRFFHLPSSPGLTDVVLRATPLEEALQTVEISSPRTLGDWELRKSEGKLELLPAGVALANPGEFMDQLPVSPILEYLKGHSDIVLIDGPPLLRVGDAIALSAILDAVVVVARINVVSGHMLEDLNRILRYSPAPILGVAVTGVKLETGYGYFSYPRSRRRASI